MNKQICEEIIKLMNELIDNETAIAKINGVIFIKDSQKKINEKIAYLYNCINIEAKNCMQRQENFFDDINLIISHYRQKLNMVYDELYCQYVNVQNELQEANIGRKTAVMNYQRVINKVQNGSMNDNLLLKENIKKENKIYKNIVNICNLKFKEIIINFEDIINKEFEISSNSLRIVSEQNIFQKMFSKIGNIFGGKKKYVEILKNYNRQVDKIDSYEIANQMRDEIIKFVTEILVIRKNYKIKSINIRIIGGKNEIRKVKIKKSFK